MFCFVLLGLVWFGVFIVKCFRRIDYTAYKLKLSTLVFFPIPPSLFQVANFPVDGQCNFTQHSLKHFHGNSGDSRQFTGKLKCICFKFALTCTSLQCNLITQRADNDIFKEAVFGSVPFFLHSRYGAVFKFICLRDPLHAFVCSCIDKLQCFTLYDMFTPKISRKF